MFGKKNLPEMRLQSLLAGVGQVALNHRFLQQNNQPEGVMASDNDIGIILLAKPIKQYKNEGMNIRFGR